MEQRGVVCVFAKPPRAGEVKTRLASAIGADAAAALARAFFEDTWRLVSTLPWPHPVLATTDPSAEEWAGVDGQIWDQGGGDLGDRMECILRRALRSAPFAIALGTDSPGLPLRLLDAARRALESADAVIGPCEDGGFYLVGLRRCPPGLLSNLPWSVADTCARTSSRLREHGLAPEILPPWFDVDRSEDLSWLRELLRRGELDAPSTARVLGTIVAGACGRGGA